MEVTEKIPPGKRGVLSGTNADQTEMIVDFGDGTTGTMSSSAPIEWPLGSTVIVWEDDFGDKHVDVVPEGISSAPLAIGVVKMVTDDAIVVEVDGRLKKVPSEVTGISKGATVEVSLHRGIVKQISSSPIRILDFSDESSRVADFIVPASQSELSYQDFAGFPDLVEEAKELIELSIDEKNVIGAIGARPVKGLLFTGDPGSGKTLLARIICQEVGATFYQVNGPAVMGRWVGQSEEVLRALFDHAKDHRPAIIFFDEIDSLAVRRDIDSSESSQRVVGQLLTLMDGFHSIDRLLIIAATNRVDQIDPALRRPGRFDRELVFRLPDAVDRKAIMDLQASRFTTAADTDFSELVEATAGWTAAEVAAVWNEAAFIAAAGRRSSIRSFDLASGHERQERLRSARQTDSGS